MPQVDFTLEDIAKQAEGIVDRSIERALIKERAYNRVMMREVAEEVSRVVAEEVIVRELASFWEHNLEPAFEAIHDDIQDVRNHVGRLEVIVDQHSKDIMELRARTA